MIAYALAITNVVAGVYLVVAGLYHFRESSGVEMSLSLIVAALGFVVLSNGFRLWP